MEISSHSASSASASSRFRSGKGGWPGTRLKAYLHTLRPLVNPLANQARSTMYSPS